MTDYCTLWPDRHIKLGKDWSQCCARHDIAYATPGVSRLDADLELARCVYDATGWTGWAALMLAGVVTFGWAFRKVKRGKK